MEMGTLAEKNRIMSEALTSRIEKKSIQTLAYQYFSLKLLY